MNQLILTLNEAADRMGVDYAKAHYRFLNRQVPGGFRVGECWRVQRVVLEAWIEGGRSPDDPNGINGRLLTLQEVADLLRKWYTHVHKLATEEVLPGTTRMGRRWNVRGTVLQAWMDAGGTPIFDAQEASVIDVRA